MSNFSDGLLSFPPQRSRPASAYVTALSERAAPVDDARSRARRPAEVRRETRATRRAAVGLPWVHAVLMCYCLFCWRRRSFPAMPASEALLSAKFLRGRRAVFSNSSELKTADRNTQGPSDPPLHSRPSQRQLFTGWQSDKELGELLRRGVRRQGEQWLCVDFSPPERAQGRVSLLCEGWLIVMCSLSGPLIHTWDTS